MLHREGGNKFQNKRHSREILDYQDGFRVPALSSRVEWLDQTFSLHPESRIVFLLLNWWEWNGRICEYLSKSTPVLPELQFNCMVLWEYQIDINICIFLFDGVIGRSIKF